MFVLCFVYFIFVFDVIWYHVSSCDVMFLDVIDVSICTNIISYTSTTATAAAKASTNIKTKITY